jgi:Protein kinase domain
MGATSVNFEIRPFSPINKGSGANHTKRKTTYDATEIMGSFDDFSTACNSNVIENFSPTSNLMDRKQIHIQGDCYLKTKNEKFKKHWIVIMGNELYCYKSAEETEHLLMHTLVGTFAKDMPEETAPEFNVKFWPLKVIIPPGKSRVLYFAMQSEKDRWLRALYHCTRYTDINDYYRFDVALGKGQFGQVKLAIHHKTGFMTAVKVIKKRDMKPLEVFQQRKETEVLKMCQHPNIVKLVDLFETIDSYYIVLEYLDGKDLFDYLKTRSFKIAEERTKSIVYQIALAV